MGGRRMEGFRGRSTRWVLRCGALTLALLLATRTSVQAQELLTLEEALALARENNYALRLARGETLIARNNASIGNAGFLPSLTLSAGRNGSIANTNQTFIGREPSEQVGALSNQRRAAALLDWTLFDGLSRFATLDRLQALEEQQAVSAEQTSDLVLADVTIGYFDLVRQQEQLGVLEEAVELSEERLRIAELRRDLGSSSEQEVRQASVDLNADRAALLRQRLAFVNAKADFVQRLVRPGTLDFAVADTIMLGPPFNAEALADAALEANPSLRFAEQDRRVAELERREIRAERFPTVSAEVGYAYSNQSAEAGFLTQSRSLDFTYGLAAQFSLFDGFNRRRRIENAQVRVRNAQVAVEQARAQLQTELVQQFESYEVSLELVALEQENLEAARLNVEVALERFRLGTTTSVELREVQETLTEARSRLLTAQFEAKRAETELLRLSGALEVE